MRKRLKLIALGLAISVVGGYAALAYAAATVWQVQSFSVNGTQIFEIKSDGATVVSGPIRRANYYTATNSKNVLPTASTGSGYSSWVLVYNVGPAVVKGNILISSNTGTGYVTVSTATAGLNTVVGVAAEDIASGANGWMIPRGGGYATVLTTGTVTIGQILWTSGVTTGYATSMATPVAGTEIGTAMSTGVSGGGYTLVLMY